jgi:hypothetical protein
MSAVSITLKYQFRTIRGGEAVIRSPPNHHVQTHYCFQLKQDKGDGKPNKANLVVKYEAGVLCRIQGNKALCGVQGFLHENLSVLGAREEVTISILRRGA